MKWRRKGTKPNINQVERDAVAVRTGRERPIKRGQCGERHEDSDLRDAGKMYGD